MSGLSGSSGATAAPLERFGPELGRVLFASGARGSRALIVTAGMHGNEPSGVRAMLEVASQLRSRGLETRGRCLFAVGNLAALRAGVRFLGTDLNRCFDASTLAAIESGRRDGPEDQELAELFGVIEPEVAAGGGLVDFVDLHSASAQGPPFALFGDTLRNRRIAADLPCPKILGLEETVDGSLLSWFGDRGHTSIGVEGGQHDEACTVAHHVAVLWLMLVATGQLLAADVPDLERSREVLAQASAGLPQFVGVRERHHVEPDSSFKMRPGYKNFAPIRRGEVLADEAAGEVRAGFKGRILLPLYQGQGEDGFFLGTEINEGWLKLSARLRSRGAERWLLRLPGVRRDPDREDHLLVDRRVARLRALDLCHLFGYRRVSEAGAYLRVMRRREGLEA